MPILTKFLQKKDHINHAILQPDFFSLRINLIIFHINKYRSVLSLLVVFLIWMYHEVIENSSY